MEQEDRFNVLITGLTRPELCDVLALQTGPEVKFDVNREKVKVQASTDAKPRRKRYRTWGITSEDKVWEKFKGCGRVTRQQIEDFLVADGYKSVTVGPTLSKLMTKYKVDRIDMDTYFFGREDN